MPTEDELAPLPPLDQQPAMEPGEQPIDYSDGGQYAALDAVSPETMNGVSADSGYMPEDTIAQVAPIPQTGTRFDFNSLVVQTKEDFQRLPDEQKELLRAMKRGVQFTPQSAAQFVLEQQKMRINNNEKMRVAQSDPARAEKRQGALNTIGQMRGTVNELLQHPGFSGSVGAKNASYLFGMKSEPFAGTAEADWKAMHDQIQGGAFLQAFENLKGGGQITQVEGEKATQAIVRAQQSQSEEGFKKSMGDFLSVLDASEARLKGGAQPAASQSPAATPSPSPAQIRPTKMIGGVTYQKADDGKWYPKPR